MSIEIRGVVEMQKGLKKMATMDDVKQAIRVNTTEMHQKARDRKSTRLNSSHVSISYAVFCLKNKMKHNNFNTIIIYSKAKIDINKSDDFSINIYIN